MPPLSTEMPYQGVRSAYHLELPRCHRAQQVQDFGGVVLSKEEETAAVLLYVSLLQEQRCFLYGIANWI